MGRPRGATSGAQKEWGGLSLQECADQLGCSRQAVQQVERNALQKLHRWCEAHPAVRELLFECLHEGLAQQRDEFRILR
jgi:predicted DNA-binding protein YlxM (UPF0122 family)